MSDLVLAVNGLHAGYGGEDVLHGVAIEVGRGRIVAIIGPNGSGKSTLLKAIYGLIPARRGEVTLFDTAGNAQESRRHEAQRHHRPGRQHGPADRQRVPRAVRAGEP